MTRLLDDIVEFNHMITPRPRWNDMESRRKTVAILLWVGFGLWVVGALVVFIMLAAIVSAWWALGLVAWVAVGVYWGFFAAFYAEKHDVFY